MEKRLDKIDKKIDALADIVAQGFCGMQDQMDKRFLGVDKRFEQIDQRFEQVDKRFEQIDQRFEQVDKRFEQIDQRFEQVDKEIDTINDRHDSILNILDRHTKLLMDNRVERAATIHRIDRLEKDILKIKKKVKLAN